MGKSTSNDPEKRVRPTLLGSHSCITVWRCARPRSRHGARHIVDAVLQMTSAISLSGAALFLDLDKAFDRAVRDAAMGYPSHIGSDPTSRRAHLENVDFPPVIVREISRMIESRPPLLEEWGVSVKATRFIAALHSGSGFRYGDCLPVAETRHGGRQRCKLRSTIFHVFYAEGLVRLQLMRGCVARVVCSSRPFDPESADTGSAVPNHRHRLL